MDKPKKKRSKSSITLWLLLLVLLGMIGFIMFQPEAPHKNQYTFYRNLGDSLYRLKQYPRAIRHYESALTYKPNDRYVLTQLQFMEKNKEKTTFEEVIGGQKREVGKDALIMSDGSFLVAGTTESFGKGNTDAWLVKMDNKGQLDWRRTHGTSAKDVINNIIQTPDKQYLAIGTSNQNGSSNPDIWLLKLNEKGRLVWQKTYGTPLPDYGMSLTTLPNNDGYALLTWMESRQHNQLANTILMVDKEGNQLQQMTDTTYQKRGKNIQSTTDGHLIMVGYQQGGELGSNDKNAFIDKIDGNGTEIWSQTVGKEKEDVFQQVFVDKKGTCTAVGYTQSYGRGKKDVLIVQYQSDGQKIWQKAIGGPQNDIGNDIIGTRDGGFAIAGSTDSYGNAKTNMWLLKLGAAGNLTWRKEYGQAAAETATALTRTAKDHYLLVGNQDNNMWVLKLDEKGEQ